MSEEIPQNFHPSADWIYSLTKEHTFDAEIVLNNIQKEKAALLLARPNLNEAIKKIRQKINIPVNGFVAIDDVILTWAKHLFNDLKKKKQFDTLRFKLLDDLRVSSRWKNVVDYYLLFNREDIEHLIPPPLQHSLLNDNGKIRLTLEFFKGTTFADLEAYYNETLKNLIPLLGEVKEQVATQNESTDYLWIDDKVIPLTKPDNKKRRLILRLADQIQVYKLKLQNKTYPQIAKAMGWGANYSQVGTYLSRLDKAIKEQEFLE